jgi:hypothetical protein
MQEIRRRIGDRKVRRLVRLFLGAGVLKDEQLLRPTEGTPQGGVISPLLANTALGAIERRYQRWVNCPNTRRSRTSDGIRAAAFARSTDRRAGRPVFFPIRYADDFVVLVAGDRRTALEEKTALGVYLRDQLGLQLSPEKTRVTSLLEGFEFLGHRVRIRWHARYGYTPRVEIPKAKIVDVRYRIKQLTRRERVQQTLDQQLHGLNSVLRGWGHFYQHCTNAKPILTSIDWYVGDRLWRWMRKKYPKAGARWIGTHRRCAAIGHRKVWKTDHREQYLVGRLSVRRYRRGWMRSPAYACSPGEPDA